MRSTYVIAIASVLLLAPLRTQAQQDLAQEYNLEGMKAYWHLDWKTAEECFRKALKENPSHKLANYNLACVLSIKLSGDHWSWDLGNGSPDDPLDQLAHAIEVDPDAVSKALHDPDFSKIRLTPKFQILIGADLKDSELIRQILLAQGEWYGGPCGAWCGNNLIFLENGEVVKKAFGEDGHAHGFFRYIRGHYSIQDGVATMEFESGEVLHAHFIMSGPLTGVMDVGQIDDYFVAPTGDI